MRGDRLMSVNGERIVNFLDWTPKIERLKAGQRMDLEVIRDGDMLSLAAEGKESQLAGIIYFDWQYRLCS
jgi:S1-C subfamily serine protease